MHKISTITLSRNNLMWPFYFSGENCSNVPQAAVEIFSVCGVFNRFSKGEGYIQYGTNYLEWSLQMYSG